MGTVPLVLASRGRRLLAALIDLVLLALVSIAILLATGVFSGPEAYSSVAAFYNRLALPVALAYLLLNGYPLARHSQTIGKRLLGLKLISMQSRFPLALWRSLVRAALVLLVLKVPYAMVLVLVDPLFIFGPYRRCLRDYIVNSIVVKVDGETAALKKQ